MAIFSSRGVEVTPGSVSCSVAGATPSGLAKATNSSSVAKRTLSRASRRASSMAEGSSDPAHAVPTWAPLALSRSTRMPIPADVAVESSSIAPW
jgi:hypothetical protein